MPHITLKAPFAISYNQDIEVREWFTSLTIKSTAFEVELNGFGCFDKPKNPVIFVKPKLSSKLISLQKEIIEAFEMQFPELKSQFSDKDFHPHMTIAYRDLTYPEFGKAWEKYSKKEYQNSFNVQHIFLLKHNKSSWEILVKKNIGI